MPVFGYGFAAMKWTPEQQAVLAHPFDAHAIVRAVPGAGKTTTLVGRVIRLVKAGVPAERIRVVMFNKSVQLTFEERLVRAGVLDVKVSTFDALGLEVLLRAKDQGLLTRKLEFVPNATRTWALRAKSTLPREALDTAEQIEDAVGYWKANLVSPDLAVCRTLPVLVDAYRFFERRRLRGDVLRVALGDLVYEAVAVLRTHPGVLGPVDHFLVDEFQDVNPARVALMRGLMSPSTSVMAVGDEDQAINEWCGAHPRFFLDFEEHFPSLPTTVYPLSQSFRFGAKLAHAANVVIRHNLGRRPVEVVGGGATPGEVRLTGSPVKLVQHLLAQGTSPKDIAVLYRSRSQGVDTLAALVCARVPLRTDDAESLKDGPGAELALAWLQHASSDVPVTFEEAWRFVHGEKRYIAKAPFAKHVEARGKDGMRAILANRDGAKACGQNGGGLRSLGELADTLRRVRAEPLAGRALACVPSHLVQSSFQGRIRDPREQEVAVATFFAVVQILTHLGVPVAGAVDALQGIDSSLGEPLEKRVWVSTIHKAKGLEWSHVILPRLVEGATPAQGSTTLYGSKAEPEGIAQTDWVEQERRIFYVGQTRAIHTLWLHAPAEKSSRFVFELFEEPWSPEDGLPSYLV